jgi:pSer/pThr/pTyr-binding forkhead associated (FHA) protein
VGKAAELVDESQRGDKTMVAARSGASKQAMALVDRVFSVNKAPHAQRGPIMLGRSSDNDIAIPEYSISKHQCFFEFEPDGIKISDCGSTNGTLVEDEQIPVREPVIIKDGTKISLGRFEFVFHTAAGFHAYVKSLLS